MTDALILVSDTFYLAFSFKFINISFQIFLLFVPEMLLVSGLTLFRLSTFLWFGSYNHWILACFLWFKNYEHSSSNHGLYFFNLYRPRLSLAKVVIFSLMFSQAIFVSLLTFKFSKAANLFGILMWYCFLTSSSLSFLRLNLSTSHFCAAFFTYCQSFPNFCNHQLVISIIVSPHWNVMHWVYSNAISCLSVCDQSRCESSHQERSRCMNECLSAGTSCS